MERKKIWRLEVLGDATGLERTETGKKVEDGNQAILNDRQPYTRH